ncbi:MAG TPA: SRPBCC family protein [Streptosporangiaceae bacterium]|nr:SRPBCC family protein [Streptosporangiaceae bacterium]
MIDGDAVVHELVLPAPAEQVFDMFTDPRLLVRWLGISADLQPQPDGRFRFEVAPGQFCEGQYVIVERPGRLVFTWGWTDPGFGLPPGTSQVEVTLTSAGDDGRQCRLRLVHTGLAGDLGLLHDDGWSRFLARLTAAATGEALPAYPAEQPEQRLTTLRQRAREDN